MGKKNQMEQKFEREIKQLHHNLEQSEREKDIIIQSARAHGDEMAETIAMLVKYIQQIKPEQTGVYDELARERAKQDMKHGAQSDLTDDDCFIFTMEEVGEVAKALYELRGQRRCAEGDPFNQDVYPKLIAERERHLRDEIIQAAACFVKWAQIIDRRALGEQEEVDFIQEITQIEGEARALADIEGDEEALPDQWYNDDDYDEYE